MFCAWKLKIALATILQSSGFLPAFKKIASFPREFSSSYLRIYNYTWKGSEVDLLRGTGDFWLGSSVSWCFLDSCSSEK